MPRTPPMPTPGRPWASRPAPRPAELPPPNYSLMYPPPTQQAIDRWERKRLGLPAPPSRLGGGYWVAWAVTLAWLGLIAGGSVWWGLAR